MTLVSPPIHLASPRKITYISLESTVSKMSVEIIVKYKNELLLKMETPPSLS